MSKLIFVNLPVADLSASMAFYERVGFTNNPQFTDNTAACMVLSETIHVMLLTHEKFSFFCKRPIADAHATAQMLICISAASREDVDAIVTKAAESGGKADPNAPQDFGFMYGRSYEDLDGHIFEVMFMDMEAAQRTMTQG
ncbi:VOC family protein [Pseudoroseomonas globiformis]|uniref:VOC family protein n=1 Tax=Teichococcus globiformis TaxID=2307229 RepID=A0ABV7FWQ5_9PROT